MQKLAINSNNVVEINSLTNTITGAYVDDATVTLTVRDLQTGDAVEGGVWPVNLLPVGSGGVYRATLDSFIELNKNREHVLDLTAATVNEQTSWQTVVPAVDLK